MSLASFLLERARAAVVAGTSFGEYGEKHLCVSYANLVENIEAGLAALRELLEAELAS